MTTRIVLDARITSFLKGIGNIYINHYRVEESARFSIFEKSKELSS